MKKYKWNYSKLTAISIVITSIVFMVLVSSKAVLNPLFISQKLAINYSLDTSINSLLWLFILVINIMVNIRFFRKKHNSDKQLALFHILIICFIVRVLYIEMLFSSFNIMEYWGVLLSLIVNGILIYNILFSESIKEYYHKE